MTRIANLRAITAETAVSLKTHEEAAKKRADAKHSAALEKQLFSTARLNAQNGIPRATVKLGIGDWLPGSVCTLAGPAEALATKLKREGFIVRCRRSPAQDRTTAVWLDIRW